MVRVIKLSPRELQDFESALHREWLETNGLGGYASSTVLGINTRKYHSLLTAAVRPPVERMLVVSHLDETVIIGGVRLEIFSNEYEETVFPEGHRYLEEVRLDPYPVFTYVVGGVKLEKSIFMQYGHNTTCVTYSVQRLPNGPRPSQVILEVRPILAFRDHHALMREDPAFGADFDAGPGTLRFRPYDHLPSLNTCFKGGYFQQDGYWYRRFRYRREHESGYDSTEDLFCPGKFVFNFEGSSRVWLTLSTEDGVIRDVEDLRSDEVARRKRLTKRGTVSSDLGKQLVRAADAFIVKRRDSCSVLAGYPWFTDWGRDTMISLPGLTLATGRLEEAQWILSTFIDSMDGGLIPNRFPDSGSGAEYNTIDATLWLFEAVRKYYQTSQDSDFIAQILPMLRESIRCHLDGTKYGIKAQEDGLLAGGSEDIQLTWMDAKIGNKVITARVGKPVEVNALWYNALRITADFCSDFGGLAEESKYDYLAGQAFESFNAQFWNQDQGCLYDYINGDYKDDAVRPNQIIAVSLTYPALEHAKWKSVVTTVERDLLTPYGLRTLSPTHPDYKATYRGDLEARDHAYHQGTVWPWLMGHFITAYLRANGRSGQTLAYCLNLLEGFAEHMREAGLGTVSEIFDGDTPHRPNGCIAQAWSVAELLRVLTEDLFITTSQNSKETRQLA
jgi:predicted glycogen debranching enzyme